MAAMPRERAGVALGAQVRRAVTQRASPEGYLIYTVFTKKCQKRYKKGVPPILTTFWEEFTFLVPQTSAWGLGCRFCPLFPILKGQKSHFEPKFRGGGS